MRRVRPKFFIVGRNLWLELLLCRCSYQQSRCIRRENESLRVLSNSSFSDGRCMSPHAPSQRRCGHVVQLASAERIPLQAVAADALRRWLGSGGQPVAAEVVAADREVHVAAGEVVLPRQRLRLAAAVPDGDDDVEVLTPRASRTSCRSLCPCSGPSRI